jgi:hypothetical protein
MPSESLSKKQQRFSWLLAKLIFYANEAGYGVTMGECWRTPEQAAANARTGKGIANSVHCDRLAVDINLFRDGKYLTDGKHYKILGDWWVAQCEDCRWGGLFPRKDFNHYSFTYGGRA